MHPHLLLRIAAATLLVACGAPAESPGGDVAAPARTALGYPGMYEVSGVTTDQATGDTRRITGTVIIAVEAEDGYAATFSMTTELTTRDGPLKADLIGTGKGSPDGARLVGRAETQMFLAAIPGLDPKFPFIPGQLGPRIVSSFTMEPAEDGYKIEIETQGAPGEEGAEYGRTRTTLRAVRTHSALGAPPQDA